MNTPLLSTLSFLAILNPFALSLYLVGIMEDLDAGQFRRVLLTATLISAAVFLVFVLTGEQLLINILGVRPDALRIFGGIIFFSVGYNYATKGYKAAVALRGNLDELPSQIALPYMIGAGTITQAILIGRNHPHGEAFVIVLLTMIICFLVVLLFDAVRDRLRSRHEAVFMRYVNVLCRINGLLIGALSTEMVIASVRNLWLQAA